MSLLPVRLNSIHGQPTDYVLAADDAKHLYFLQQGRIVLVLNTPANITAVSIICIMKYIGNQIKSDQ